MPILLVMMSMWVARAFGFRHRALEDELSIFRVTDVMAGVLLPCISLGAIGAAWPYIVPITLPNWVNNLLGALSVALFIFFATVWMPFVEHLSLIAPGEVTAPARRRIVIVARSIPYLYGMVVVCTALLLTLMAVMMLGAALLGFATMAGFEPERVGAATMLWIGGGTTLVLGLCIARAILMTGRLMDDWGLPAWRTFVEPGHHHPAGERLFRPLDATIGRAILATTTPSAEARNAPLPAPTHLSDLRRFDGDLFDLALGLVAGVLVAGIVASLSVALLGWLAPEQLAALSAPAPAPGTPTPLRPIEFAAFFVIGIPMLGTLIVVVRKLRRLAEQSRDERWAQQRRVRRLARALELARLLSCTLLALLFAAVLALLGSLFVSDAPWVGVVIFSIVSLVLAPAFIHASPSKDSYLLAFVANVQAANQVQEKAHRNPTGKEHES